MPYTLVYVLLYVDLIICKNPIPVYVLGTLIWEKYFACKMIEHWSE